MDGIDSAYRLLIIKNQSNILEIILDLLHIAVYPF